MKVILKAELDNLGSYGEVVKVAPGYARNYLIPKGLAAEATQGNIRQFEAEREAYMKKLQARKDKASALKAELDSVTLTFSRKTSEDDRLFGSVTAHDIDEALKAKGFEVDRKGIVLAEPIKTLGESTVGVKLLSGIVAEVKVSVVKEE